MILTIAPIQSQSHTYRLTQQHLHFVYDLYTCSFAIHLSLLTAYLFAVLSLHIEVSVNAPLDLVEGDSLLSV